ncbi:MAG: hypothetical protein ABSB69_10090 [Solirubrobacteraceae bacterium]
MQTRADRRSARHRAHRRRHAARLTGTLMLTAAVLLSAAASASAAEQLKLVVSPLALSLASAESEGFTVNVSGSSSKHAALTVFYQLGTHAQCAATGGKEMVRKGVSQLQPIPATPSAPQRFPANPSNFHGSFDWHGTITVFKGTAGPGSYLVCGYLAPKDSSGKPFLGASAKFTLTAT